MKVMPMPLDSPTPAADRKEGIRARVVSWLLDDAPPREEARRRIRSRPGLIASLSPEALEYIRSYDGPENMGPPHPRL